MFTFTHTHFYSYTSQTLGLHRRADTDWLHLRQETSSPLPKWMSMQNVFKTEIYREVPLRTLCTTAGLPLQADQSTAQPHLGLTL